MNHDIENTSLKPEIITVEVTEEDFIEEAKRENVPLIFGQLRYHFWYCPHEYWEKDRYSFLTALCFNNPDSMTLSVCYDSGNKLIRLNYDFLVDDVLGAYFFRGDAYEIMSVGHIEETRAVTRILPALINRHMETAWLCYDKEEDSMWCTAGIYATGPKLNKKYLARVMRDIVRCRDLCLHILENVAYGTSASETEINIKALIESYSWSREAAASDTLD